MRADIARLVVRAAWLALAALAAIPSPVRAQWASGTVAGYTPTRALRATLNSVNSEVAIDRPALTARVDAPGSEHAGTTPGLRVGTGLGEAERRRWAPVASLLLPGSGQALLHQDRFVAYLALEAWAVLEFANQRTEGRRQQARYRALASNVARSLYGSTFPVGTWAYYESMEHYLESGVFDRVPGGDVDPDVDVSTYNGAMWLLARTTYWADPSLAPSTASAEYRRAMNFYVVRAVRAEYRWSWRNAQLEQDLYVRTIRRANTSFRGARAALGAVLANHLLSTVDAFVTLRVEGLEGAGEHGFALRGSLPIR